MRCHGFLAAIVTGWAAAEQLSLEIHVAGRYRPLHFARGDDYEAVARAWLEENPKAANGACAKAPPTASSRRARRTRPTASVRTSTATAWSRRSRRSSRNALRRLKMMLALAAATVARGEFVVRDDVVRQIVGDNRFIHACDGTCTIEHPKLLHDAVIEAANRWHLRGMGCPTDARSGACVGGFVAQRLCDASRDCDARRICGDGAVHVLHPKKVGGLSVRAAVGCHCAMDSDAYLDQYQAHGMGRAGHCELQTTLCPFTCHGHATFASALPPRARIAVFVRDPFARAWSVRVFDEATSGRRAPGARPAIALTDLEPQACYLEGLPAFLGVLENAEDDWPRFLTTFAKECAAIGGCAQRLDKRHEGAAYKSADQRPLDPAEAALVRVAFAHDIRLHAAATDLSLVSARWPHTHDGARIDQQASSMMMRLAEDAVRSVLIDFSVSGRRNMTCFMGPVPIKVVTEPDGSVRGEALLDDGWRRRIDAGEIHFHEDLLPRD